MPSFAFNRDLPSVKEGQGASLNISYIENFTDTAPETATLAGYRDELKNIKTRLEKAQSQKYHSLFALVGFLSLLIVFLAATRGNRPTTLALSSITAIGVSLALRRCIGVRAASLELAHRNDFYERGIARLTGAWHGKGVTGQEFARDHHLYQWDLNILGNGSLFELLCTTRSNIGAERLASYLLDPVDVVEARARQDAVKELRDTFVLREEIAVLGEYSFQECSSLILREWLNVPILAVHRTIPYLLLVSGPTCLTLGILGLTTFLAWSQLFPVLIPLAVLQIGVCIALSSRIGPYLKNLEMLTSEFVVLRQGLDLMQRQQFRSEKLNGLVQIVRKQNASAQVRRLERLVSIAGQRKKEWAYVLSFLLAAGTQLVLAVERWRSEHQNDLKSWLDAWAEFEALNALACYAYEHPTAVFPELTNQSAVLEAKNLGHPLLAENVCVGNDVTLNETTRFYLVSGSNMAGKSTFLRAIGMNAVLASAGAPVCAASANMSVFAIGAIISVTDSLLEGKSKFLAEVEKIKEILGSTRGKLPVLFLLDEILSGTNSRDRRAAAEPILRSLVATGAVGALSTHDLALTEIADMPGLQGLNLHMDSKHPDDPLDFDYRVKAGVSQRSNALAIVKMMGIGI